MTDLPPASRAGRSGGRRCAARRAHPRATAEAPVDAVGIIGLTHHLGLVGGRALVRLAVGMVESLTHYAPTSIGSITAMTVYIFEHVPVEMGT